MGPLGRHKEMPVQQLRLAKACALVASVVLAMGLLLAMPEDGRGAADVSSSATTGRIWESIVQGKTFDEAIEEAGLLKVCKENTPGWFEDEVLDAGFVEGAIANSGFDVVYISKTGSQVDVADAMVEMLADKGWQHAAPEESSGEGTDQIMTFFKRNGGCRWAMIECVQAGEEVSVVLHTRHT